MHALAEIVSLIVNAFATLFLMAVILRFLLQSARADFYNPLSQMLVKVTNPLLMPLRRWIPGLMGIDLASLVLALLVHALAMQVLVLLVAGQWVMPHQLLVWSLIGLALNILSLYMVAGFIVAIASFVAPFSHNPALKLLNQMLMPLVAPIRRVVPPLGGFDFSLLFVFLALKIVAILVRALGGYVDTPFGALVGLMLL